VFFTELEFIMCKPAENHFHMTCQHKIGKDNKETNSMAQLTDREEIRRDIQNIAERHEDIENEVTAYVGKVFTLVLEGARSGPVDINEATKNILIDVEQGLKQAGYENHDLMAKAAEAIVDATREISLRSLEKARSHAERVRDSAEKELGKNTVSIVSLKDSTREEMEEAGTNLYQQTRNRLEQMEAVGRAIYDYSAEKTIRLGETKEMKAIVEKCGSYAKEMEGQVSGYSKHLLVQGQKKLADWLEQLSSMIKPDQKDESKSDQDGSIS